MAQKIISAQQDIIGPVAVEQAGKVSGLKVDWVKKNIVFEGSKKEIIEKLVEQYKSLFGQASVEMCRDAVRTLIPQLSADQLPSSLK